MTWIVAHREAWPKEVKLSVDTPFSVLVKGKVVGNGTVPAGDTVSLLQINLDAGKVLLASTAYGGSTQSVPIGSTNLRDLATPILIRSADPSKPAATKLMVKPLNFPPQVPLHYEWKQIQDVLSPVAAQMDHGKLINFDSTSAAETSAQFPDSGVYEIKVTVSEPQSGKSASRNTWVRVWDDRSPIVVNGKPDPLCVAPGITPPTSVRTISPDPGPFHHPRLYCTNADWPKIHQRTINTVIASLGLKKLREQLEGRQKGFETEGTPYQKLTTELEAYADSNYTAQAPT